MTIKLTNKIFYVKNILIYMGVIIPIVVITIMYILYLLLPHCEELNTKWKISTKEICDSEPDICSINYSCERSYIPLTLTKCLFDGYMYYPPNTDSSDTIIVPCPTEYIFPHWIAVICATISLISGLIYLKITFGKRCWQCYNPYIPWITSNNIIEAECRNCNNLCKLVPRTAVCGLCAGIGKISEISFESIKNIDIYDIYNIEHTKLNDICSECKGKGHVPIFEQECNICDEQYDYINSNYVYRSDNSLGVL